MVATNTLTAATFKIVSLYRYAIKGLGPGDELTSVHFSSPGQTFPDDRRYALQLKRSKETFLPSNPQWLHKENFLCAFTAPELLTTFESRYDDVTGTLRVWKRSPKSDDEAKEAKSERTDQRSSATSPLLKADLSTPMGRDLVSSFFTKACGEDVRCIVASSDEHQHQFGNTRSAVKKRGDTRTIHIVNAATVRDVSKKLGIPLNPQRFRPNIVLDDMAPWEEFNCVGKSLEVEDGGEGLILDVIERTVRCKGVSIDPFDLERGSLDIPKLLQENFPEHGPYLGVYAVVRKGGKLNISDKLKLAKINNYQNDHRY